MEKELFEKICKEISDTQERRHKLSIYKITLATTLMGLGSIRINDIAGLDTILLLVPLPVVFIDLLIAGESFSIRRLGKWIRENSSSGELRDFEKFIFTNQDTFYKIGAMGFTALSIVTSFLLYWLVSKGKFVFAATWFGSLAMVSCVSLFYVNWKIKSF